MRIADISIAKGDTVVAKKELNNVIAAAKDTWMKQEAERKIKELEAKLKVETPAPEKIAPVKKETAKPAEKKKGLFSR